MLFGCIENGIRKMSHDGVRGVKLESVVAFFEGFAPKDLAQSWDNTGLLIEPMTEKNVKNLFLTNDLTENVVKEATLRRADLIVSYHPPIFHPLTNITAATWKERIVGACLENKIALYSPHTRWDSVQGGVNDWLASAFEFEAISPILHGTNSTNGIGRFLKLKKEISLSKAVNNVKNLTNQPHLQIAIARGATLETNIREVALCAGSGGSVLKGNCAQLYVTGEMDHHALLDAVHCGSSVILCSHSNSERGYLSIFKKEIEREFNNDVNVVISREDRDPLQFV